MGNEASSTKASAGPMMSMDGGMQVRQHTGMAGGKSYGGCATGGCGSSAGYLSAPYAGSCKSGANCHRVAAYNSHPYGMDLAGTNGGLPDALPRDCSGCGTCAGGTCGTACGGVKSWSAVCGGSRSRVGMCESMHRPDPADAYPDRPVLSPWGQSVRANRFDTQDIRGDPACQRQVKDGSTDSMHPFHFPGHSAQIDARHYDTTHPGRHDQQYSPYGCSFRGKYGCQ